MILLREINTETKKLLNRISDSSKFPQVRNRAKCIILSYQGFSLGQLMKIFGVSRRTLYNWLSRWEKQGLNGLYNEKGRGRKPKLSPKQRVQVKQWVKEEPKSLKKVMVKIYQQWGVNISQETIKRIIKKRMRNSPSQGEIIRTKQLNMLWKRMKRGLSKTPDEWELEVKIPKLLELKEQERKGKIDLRYLDESGFSLMPCIPYGWQEKGTTITLKSNQSKRINVLGLMNQKNELCYEIYSETIKSQTVINFLDKFSENLSKTTVVILDQAPVHTSDIFMAKLEEWEGKKLKLFWLPTYSPKLNLIEILWKFIKYEWVDVDAYFSWRNLLNYLRKVLDNFGREYAINFV